MVRLKQLLQVFHTSFSYLLYSVSKYLAHSLILKKSHENTDFLTRKRGFFANEVVLGQKNAQNESVCNSLIISNKTF